jgi:hypothetical protein
MAKQKADLNPIFKSTEPGSQTTTDDIIPATGRTVSVGVGLKEGEVAMLDAMADALGVSRNALMRYGLRYFLMQYQANEIKLAKDVETEDPKKRLKMPGLG